MKCKDCGGERIIEISGKTSDCFWARYRGKTYDGYVIGGLGIDDGGDYISLDLCLDCGKVQGKFPVKEEVVMQYFGDEK